MELQVFVSAFSQENEQQVHHPARQQYSHNAIRYRDEHAFRHPLADQLPAAGAESAAQAHFAGSPRATNRQQCREVGTGDQEDDADQGH